jgi:hypothetical protein
MYLHLHSWLHLPYKFGLVQKMQRVMETQMLLQASETQWRLHCGLRLRKETYWLMQQLMLRLMQRETAIQSLVMQTLSQWMQDK